MTAIHVSWCARPSCTRQWLAAILFAGGLCALARPVSAQEPAAAQAGAALIAAAEQDKDGYLVLPLPKPQPNEPLGAFESRKLRQRSEVTRMLREDLPLNPNDKSLIDRYFNLFEFRVLTQTGVDDLEQLPKRRFDLFKTYIYAARHQENHKQLIDLTLAMMQQIVNNNFHPLVRYNAMLTIGDLNEQEVFRLGSNPLLPEPYAAALNFIVEKIDDPKTPDAIRVAALVGVVRHMEWEPFRTSGNPIPANTRTSVLNALLKLAEMKTPPAGRSAAGHEWMRRRAIEALGFASVTTAQPNVVDAIDKILKDSAEPLHLRCAAALAMGRANVPAAQKIDANELTRTLGMLAATSIKGEFDRLEKMDKLDEEHRAVLEGGTGVAGGEGFGGVPGGVPGAVPGGPRMMAGGPRMNPIGGPGGEFGQGGEFGPGGAGGLEDPLLDPKAYRLEPLRKKLRYQLYCVQIGLGHPIDKSTPAPGVQQVRKGSHRLAAAPAEKKAAEEVLAEVNKLADTIEKNKSDLPQLETDLKDGTKKLEAVLAKLVAPVAAPAPMPGDPANPKPAAPAAPASDDDLLGGGTPKKS